MTGTAPDPARTTAAAALLALVVWLASACSGGGDGRADAPPAPPAEAGADLTAASGGTVRLGEASITIPPGALSADARVTIRRAGDAHRAPAAPPLARLLGEPYLFGIDGATLRAPATVTVPYDAAQVPAESESLAPFVAAYDDAARGWQPAPSTADPARRTVVEQTDRVSWRQAWTWLVPTAREALTSTIAEVFRVAGERAAALVCEREPPSGLLLERPPNDALPACASARAGASPPAGVPTTATLSLANNRPFSVVVRRPAGAALERATRGGLYDGIDAELARAFPSAVFLPGGGTAELTLALPATPATYELTSSPQALTVGLDLLTHAVGLLVPADAVVVAPAAACLLGRAGGGLSANDGPGGSGGLGGVSGTVVDCVESVDRANPVALLLSRLRDPMAGALRSSELVKGDGAAARGRVGATWTPAERLTPASRLRLDGIGPVRVGMTLAEASAVTGLAFAVDPRSSPQPERCGIATPQGAPPGLSFMVENGTTIVRIDVRSADGSPPPIAATTGVHVGSTEAEVLAAYPVGLVVRPHPVLVPDGHYLVHAPDDPPVKGFELLFETDGKTVTTFRSGVIAFVERAEGCG